MPKIGMEPLRRKALINATIGEVGRVGSLDVTVGQIAKRAGMSSGLAHHYFGGKEQIFLAAMREILSRFGAQVRHELAQADTPLERLNAIVTASFHADNFAPDVISAWLSFYVQAQNSSKARRLLRIYARRLHSNLVYNLRPLSDNAEHIAQGMASMIDGFYLRHALQDNLPDRLATQACVMEYLELQLGRRGRSPEPRVSLLP